MQLQKGVMWKKRFKASRMGNRGRMSTCIITKIIKKSKSTCWSRQYKLLSWAKNKECASLRAGPTSTDVSAWWERQVKPSAVCSQPSDQSNSKKLGKVPSDYRAAGGSPSTSRVAQQGWYTHLRWTSAPNPRPQGEKSSAPGGASNSLLQVCVILVPLPTDYLPSCWRLASFCFLFSYRPLK